MSRAGLRSELRPSGAVCLNAGSSSSAFSDLLSAFLLHCFSPKKGFWNLLSLSPITHVGAARCRWIQLVSCAQCFYRCTLFFSAWPSWTAVQEMRAKKVKLGENTLLVSISFASWCVTEKFLTCRRRCCCCFGLLTSSSSCLCRFSPPDCVRSRGVGYRGAQQSSSSGLSCLNWTNTSRDYDLDLQPDSQTGRPAQNLHCGRDQDFGPG